MSDAQPRRPGHVITFYSYKGGTGRSMALANIAYLLAEQSTDDRPVLAIDWDLEAPGLHRYFEPFLPSSADNALGLIDYFLTVDQMRKSSTIEDPEKVARQLADSVPLGSYIQRTSRPKLRLMRAGKFDAEYATRVNTFSWPAFFTAVPDFFRFFAERLAREFSYVLIDSRTGVTDISGICTMLMPEKLVVVFTPNRQSLTGITALVKRAGDYRQSRDDTRPLVVFPLPSRIDTNYPDLVKPWRFGDSERGLTGWENEFRQLLKDQYSLSKEEGEQLPHYFDDVQIFHVAQYAFGEPIAAVDQRASDKSTVTNSYAKLIDYLDRGAPWLPPDDRAIAAVKKVSWREAVLSFLTGWSWRRAYDTVRLAAFAVFVLVGIWYFAFGRSQIASATLLQQVLKLDDKVPPTTAALLLTEALPGLKQSDHAVAVERLKKTLQLIPQQTIKWESPDVIQQAAFSSNGQYMVATTGKRVSVWRTEDGKRLDEWDAEVSQACFYRGSVGTLVTLGRGGLILWNGKMIAKSVAIPLNSPTLSANGEFVIDGHASFYRVDALLNGNNTPFLPVTQPVDAFTARFLPSSDACVIWEPSRVVVCDLRSGARDVRFGHNYSIGAISDDGKVVAVLASLLMVLNSESTTIGRIDTTANEFALSRHGDYLITATTDGTIRIFDANSGVNNGRANFKGDEAPMNIRALPDGNFLLMYRSEVLIVSKSLDIVARMTAPKNINSSFSDLASHYVALIGSNTMTVWDLSAKGKAVNANSDDELIRLTCHRAHRSLTPEEWATYLPNRDYNPRCTTGAGGGSSSW